ncbi:hypothetical protein PAEPH01_0399 [Pancytospora epiphaga]|nr:hypothetical protein PAEPH01_0399 [Pancytospora epiphaga]
MNLFEVNFSLYPFYRLGKELQKFLWPFTSIQSCGNRLNVPILNKSTLIFKKNAFKRFYVAAGRLDLRLNRVGQPNLSQVLFVIVSYHTNTSHVITYIIIFVSP